MFGQKPAKIVGKRKKDPNVSHPFGDLLSQHIHRKHGLSQAKLAEGILQDPSIIGRMCKGPRPNGPRGCGPLVCLRYRKGRLYTKLV